MRAATALPSSPSSREDNLQTKIHKKRFKKNTAQGNFLRGIFFAPNSEKRNYTFPYSPLSAVDGCGIHIFHTTASVDNKKAQKYIIPLFDGFCFFLYHDLLYMQEDLIRILSFLNFVFLYTAKNMWKNPVRNFIHRGLLWKTLPALQDAQSAKKEPPFSFGGLFFIQNLINEYAVSQERSARLQLR